MALVDQVIVPPAQPIADTLTGVFTVTSVLLAAIVRLGIGTTVTVAVIEVVTPRFVHETVKLNTCWVVMVEEVATDSTLPLGTPPEPLH